MYVEDVCECGDMCGWGLCGCGYAFGWVGVCGFWWVVVFVGVGGMCGWMCVGESRGVGMGVGDVCMGGGYVYGTGVGCVCLCGWRCVDGLRKYVWRRGCVGKGLCWVDWGCKGGWGEVYGVWV